MDIESSYNGDGGDDDDDDDGDVALRLGHLCVRKALCGQTAPAAAESVRGVFEYLPRPKSPPE